MCGANRAEHWCQTITRPIYSILPEFISDALAKLLLRTEANCAGPTALVLTDALPTSKIVRYCVTAHLLLLLLLMVRLDPRMIRVGHDVLLSHRSRARPEITM